MYVEYSSNNSGGNWWLKDKHWEALAEKGWRVRWAGLTEERDESTDEPTIEAGMPKLIEDESPVFRPDVDKNGRKRWLGTLAQYAYRALGPEETMQDAVDEWEQITGQCATDEGCHCCGQPHTFTVYNAKGSRVSSGPNFRSVASW